MIRIFLFALATVLLFHLFLGSFSLPFLQAHPAYAQATQPAPGPPTNPKITFKGGPGDKPENAVVILGASNSFAGIAAEYNYLRQKFGRRNVDWNLVRQSVLQQQGKVYDRMDLDLKDGSRKTVFFDIGEFFGKL